jgi:hypothetical protein
MKNSIISNRKIPKPTPCNPWALCHTVSSSHAPRGNWIYLTLGVESGNAERCRKCVPTQSVGTSGKPTPCNSWALCRLLTFAACILLIVSPSLVSAQQFLAEAFIGKPFGVGRIVVDLPESMLPQPLGMEGLVITEQNNRILYPAADNPMFGKIMKEVLDSDTPLTRGGPVREQVGGILRGFLDRPPRTTIYFLFRGEGTLNVTIQAQAPVQINIIPRQSPPAYRQLLALWWRQYVPTPQLFEQKPDYPPLVENYFTALLSARLNLPLPDDKQNRSTYAELEKEIGLNLGTETIRVALQRDRILGLGDLAQPADQALPDARQPPPLELPESAEDVKIDQLALHVPAEFFYVRFGSFNNFLWLQDTLEKWGGDVQNLVALRGLDHGMRERMEKQLILKQTALSRMLGPTVISDVAIVGTDMFFREGAAYGFIFEARNTNILGMNFTTQRAERIKAGGVTEEKIKIGGRDVSFISSPDGTVRSYYAVDGDYHFFTTSKTLVERFFAVGSGEGSLGKTKEFRHARAVMPLSRDDTVFVYLSDAFFRNFTGPRYRMEMARRLQAVADIELVQLAKLASAGEGKPGATVKDLIEGNFLPPSFGPLPDGSRIEIGGGEVYDSLRGRRGAFVPAPDVLVDKVTRAEVAQYNRFADYYRENWERMDPIIVGMKRTAQANNREQVVVDVLMTPFAPSHFDLLKKYAGPADNLRIAPIPGDLAAFDAVLVNQRVFAGLRDLGPPPNVQNTPNMQFGRFLPLGRMREWLVGYIGSLGEVGVLAPLNLTFPPPDPAGYSVSRIGGWRRIFDQFIVFSFQPQILAEVTPQLHLEEAQRTAQLRVRIDDPTKARIMPMLNNWAYSRTRETSLNNLRLLQALDQQLHVPPASCLEAAEFLLDAKLIDPLGGKYVYQESGKNFGRWTTTSLENQPPSAGMMKTAAPEGLLVPPCNWFRGLDLEAAVTEKNLSAHAEIIMQMPEKK